MQLPFAKPLFKAILALFILGTTTANTSVVVEIGTIRTSANQDAFRVVAFDTKRQKLLHYETLPLVPFTRPLKSFLSAYEAEGRNDREMNYYLSMAQNGVLSVAAAGVVAQNSVSKDRYIIMSSGPIQTYVDPAPAVNQSLGRHYWASHAIEEKTPVEMSHLIKGLKNKHPNDPVFVLDRHDTDEIHYLTSLTNGDKGNFGELITRMTMFSYGYNILPSIYSGNQGLDVIAVSFSGLYLALCQSKVGNANSMAQTVIKNELSEPHISERLKLMDVHGTQGVKASRMTVLQFIQDRPNSIYKLAQCLFNCGLADLQISAFEAAKFPRESGVKIYGAPAAVKLEAVRSTLGTFEPLPMDQFALALNAIPLDGSHKRQALSLLMAKFGIDAQTQASMLAHLPVENTLG